MYAFFILIIIILMVVICFFTLKDHKKGQENYPMNPIIETQQGNKFCSYCGKEIAYQAVICPHCGCPVAPGTEPDIPSAGLNALSFFIPIVGLVLYCLYHDKAPNKAKQIGKWAIISICVLSALWLLIYTYWAFIF